MTDSQDGDTNNYAIVHSRKEQPSEGVPRVVAMHVNAIPIQFRPQFPLTHMPFQQFNPQLAAQHQQQEQAEQVHHHNAMPQFRFGSPQPAVQNQFRQIPLPLQPLIRQMQQSHMSEVRDFALSHHNDSSNRCIYYSSNAENNPRCAFNCNVLQCQFRTRPTKSTTHKNSPCPNSSSKSVPKYRFSAYRWRSPFSAPVSLPRT